MVVSRLSPRPYGCVGCAWRSQHLTLVISLLTEIEPPHPIHFCGTGRRNRH